LLVLPGTHGAFILQFSLVTMNVNWSQGYSVTLVALSVNDQLRGTSRVRSLLFGYRSSVVRMALKR
jgi:hypothetical protein